MRSCEPPSERRLRTPPALPRRAPLLWGAWLDRRGLNEIEARILLLQVFVALPDDSSSIRLFRTRIPAIELVDVLHPRHDLSEGGEIVLVQIGVVAQVDEDLRVA